jgi:predicted  nucleic acid-binding Zn-ribbon protein
VTDSEDPGLRERLSRGGEEALGKIAEELAGNPVVTGALSRALEAREKALQAQEAAMGALGIPSAADIERLTRRLRSVSQRLEGIEDSVDRLDERLGSIENGVGALDGRLEEVGAQMAKLAKAPRGAAAAKKASGEADADTRTSLESRLDEIGRDIEALRRAVAPGEEPPPRAQERLTVSDA